MQLMQRFPWLSSARSPPVHGTAPHGAARPQRGVGGAAQEAQAPLPPAGDAGVQGGLGRRGAVPGADVRCKRSSGGVCGGWECGGWGGGGALVRCHTVAGSACYKESA